MAEASCEIVLRSIRSAVARLTNSLTETPSASAARSRRSCSSSGILTWSLNSAIPGSTP